MFLSLIVLRFTLTRRLKKEIFHRKEFYYKSDIPDFDLVNTILFAGVCVVPAFKRMKYHKYFVSENIDVRSFANLCEMLVAHIYIGSLAFILISGVGVVVLEWFGIVAIN